MIDPITSLSADVLQHCVNQEPVQLTPKQICHIISCAAERELRNRGMIKGLEDDKEIMVVELDILDATDDHFVTLYAES